MVNFAGAQDEILQNLPEPIKKIIIKKLLRNALRVKIIVNKNFLAAKSVARNNSL